MFNTNEIIPIIVLHDSCTIMSYCSICRGNWNRQIVQVHISLFLLFHNIFFLSLFCYCLLLSLFNRGEIVHSKNVETLHFDSQYFLFFRRIRIKREFYWFMIHMTVIDSSCWKMSYLFGNNVPSNNNSAGKWTKQHIHQQRGFPTKWLSAFQILYWKQTAVNHCSSYHYLQSVQTAIPMHCEYLLL